MRIHRRSALALILSLVALPFIGGCARDSSEPTIGIAFETLQTEYWVAGFDAVKARCAERGIRVIEAVADGDASRQLDQVRSMISRRVDGIILVPKDAQTCLPMIRAANEARIPIVLFNRPAADDPSAKSVAVVADNFALAKETVSFLIAEARKSGARHEAMIVIGDLGDINAVGRRDGFNAAIKESGADFINVVSQVPSEWNQEKAQAGVTNALQAHPNISLIFTSSDFLLPSIVSALKAAGRYKKAGEPGHVILGGFDGDATAYAMLKDGYLDATGVQDVAFEAEKCVETILALRAGQDVPPLIRDPGFVIHRGNLAERAPRMWGAQVK